MWWDALKHYGKYVIMSFGIWFCFMVDDLSLPRNFQEFEIRTKQIITPLTEASDSYYGENVYSPLPTGDEDGGSSALNGGDRSKLIALKFKSGQQRDSGLATMRYSSM